MTTTAIESQIPLDSITHISADPERVKVPRDGAEVCAFTRCTSGPGRAPAGYDWVVLRAK